MNYVAWWIWKIYELDFKGTINSFSYLHSDTSHYILDSSHTYPFTERAAFHHYLFWTE